MYQTTFKRKEIKYLISQKQLNNILPSLLSHMEEDAYPHSNISNLYYDTSDYKLILRSLDKPQYKEKLRLRSYGDDQVYCEIKKKAQGIVYKRRVSLNKQDNKQISNEINWMFKQYQDLTPKVFISYKRDSYKGIEDPSLRITFDKEILWRTNNLNLKENYGRKLLEDNQVLMEIKVNNAEPIWLVRLLSENSIFPTSFSKYGSVYKQMQEKKQLNYA